MSDYTSTYINPLTDFGFKFLFGQEDHKEFLLSLLNALMVGRCVITDVEFVDKERVAEHKDGRALIYDVHCRTASGERIIVEMQNRYQTYFKDRAVYYMSGDLYLQGRKGSGWDYRLTPVYGVFMMNFDWRDGSDERLREDVCLMNVRTHEIFSDRFWMTFLKVPLMDKDPEGCRNTLERWLYILKNMEKMDVIPKVFMQDPVFRRLGEVARVAALNEAERISYDASLKTYRDMYAIAKTERSEGLAEGIEKGIKLGIEKGRAEGREEGKTEEKRATARRFKELGIPMEIIVQGTGLSESEIDAL